MIHRHSSNDKKLTNTGSRRSDQDVAHAIRIDLLNMQGDQKEPENFSPLVADLWADLVMHHVRASLAAGEIDSYFPIDILDLVPGFGQSNWLMVQALLRRSAEIENLHIRYIPVAPQKSWFCSIRDYPEFFSLLELEVVVPMIWDYQKNDPCLLSTSGKKKWKTSNPCIILAHDRWANLPQKLLAVHYGKLLEANLALLKNSVEPDQRSQQWKSLEIGSLNSSFHKLIDHYLTHFNSSPIPYPNNALTLIERLTYKLPHKYLLLSAAPGFASEHSLRLCSFTKIIENYEKDGAFPVNFHFLSHYLHQSGLDTEEVEMQKGMVLQIAMHGHVEERKRIKSLAQKVDAGMFHHATALNEAMSALGVSAALDSRLALLKLSQFDPSLFMASHAVLIKSFAKSPCFDHKSWCDALERVWGNHLPSVNSSKLHAYLAPVAMHCGHWKLARSVLLRGLQAFGKTANDLANLAWCEARTGKIKNARTLIAEALRNEPENGLTKQVSERIEGRLAYWDDRWRQDIHHDKLPIALEPLDLSHAEAFFYQYRDPQIAVMTGLPVLNTIEDVRSWITAQEAETDRADYSIMHADFGFVGYINFSVSDHASYFCFWTGVDFQGNGIATAAARMAIKFASHLGVNVILTSAYSDNARSIRALKRIGFSELEIRALPPDHDRIFFSLVENNDANVDSATELVNYYFREKLPLHFSAKETREAVKESD